jgi:hypothetical protein
MKDSQHPAGVLLLKPVSGHWIHSMILHHLIILQCSSFYERLKFFLKSDVFWATQQFLLSYGFLLFNILYHFSSYVLAVAVCWKLGNDFNYSQNLAEFLLQLRAPLLFMRLNIFWILLLLEMWLSSQ